VRLSGLLVVVATSGDLVEEVTVPFLALEAVPMSDVVGVPAASLVGFVIASSKTVEVLASPSSVVGPTMFSWRLIVAFLLGIQHVLSLVEEVLTVLHEVHLLQEEVCLLAAEALCFEDLSS